MWNANNSVNINFKNLNGGFCYLLSGKIQSISDCSMNNKLCNVEEQNSSLGFEKTMQIE